MRLVCLQPSVRSSPFCSCTGDPERGKGVLQDCKQTFSQPSSQAVRLEQGVVPKQ